MRSIKFRAWSTLENDFLSPKEWKNRVWVDELGEIRSLSTVKLMPYTGLKDKNGKEIYEDDIVRHATDDGVYKVIFEDGGFYVKNLFEYDFQTINEYPLEVIGNIYENPELLEESE